MPLIVDKAERRAWVAGIAFDLVADTGIGAVTFRQVAEATGSSTAIVTNYFSDKNDLLFEIYRIANRRAMARLEAAFEDGAELIDILVSVLPVDHEMEQNWRVWLAFWSLSHSEPAFRVETAENTRASIDLYVRMLEARYQGKFLASASLLERMAVQLIASVGGSGMQSCLAPEAWPISRSRQIIAAELEAIDASVAALEG